jgi:hypothetical protein
LMRASIGGSEAVSFWSPAALLLHVPLARDNCNDLWSILFAKPLIRYEFLPIGLELQLPQCQTIVQAPVCGSHSLAILVSHAATRPNPRTSISNRSWLSQAGLSDLYFQARQQSNQRRLSHRKSCAIFCAYQLSPNHPTQTKNNPCYGPSSHKFTLCKKCSELIPRVLSHCAVFGMRARPQ